MIQRSCLRGVLASAALAALLSAWPARPVAAGPLAWTIEATLARFSPFFEPEFATLSGSFRFDAATGAYSDWDILFSAGSDLDAANSTLSGASSPTRLSLSRRSVFGDPPSFTADWAIFDVDLTLFFATPLTDAGGTVALAPDTSWYVEFSIFEFLGAGSRFTDGFYIYDLVGGLVTGAPPPPPAGIPAPPALLLCVPAIGLLAAASRSPRRT